jgi:hypothetical protein
MKREAEENAAADAKKKKKLKFSTKLTGYSSRLKNN